MKDSRRRGLGRVGAARDNTGIGLKRKRGGTCGPGGQGAGGAAGEQPAGRGRPQGEAQEFKKKSLTCRFVAQDGQQCDCSQRRNKAAVF